MISSWETSRNNQMPVSCELENVIKSQKVHILGILFCPSRVLERLIYYKMFSLWETSGNIEISLCYE